MTRDELKKKMRQWALTPGMTPEEFGARLQDAADGIREKERDGLWLGIFVVVAIVAFFWLVA